MYWKRQILVSLLFVHLSGEWEPESSGERELPETTMPEETLSPEIMSPDNEITSIGENDKTTNEEQHEEDEEEESEESSDIQLPSFVTSSNTICDLPQCTCTDNEGINMVYCTCDEENKDCEVLTIKKNAFSNLKFLSLLHFENIQDIETESNSFYIPLSLPERRLHFMSSGIFLESQNTFRGHLGNVLFQNMTIKSSIAHGCFQNLVLDSLLIVDSILSEIKKGAFHNSDIATFKCQNSVIDVIKERAIRITAHEIVLINNKIGFFYGDPQERALKNNNITYTFIGNEVENTYENAFSFKSMSNVVIHNNIFNYVQSKSFDIAATDELAFSFLNNEFKFYEEGALKLTTLTTIDKLKLFDRCKCSKDGITKYLLDESSSDEERSITLNALMCKNQDGLHVYINDYVHECQEKGDTTEGNICEEEDCDCTHDDVFKIHCICKDKKALEITTEAGPGKLPQEAEEIFISDCDSLYIRSNAFTGVGIRKLEILRVQEILIEPRGIFVTDDISTEVHIESSRIYPKSKAIGGHLVSIQLHGVEMPKIIRKTFCDLELSWFTVEDSNILEIKESAFSNCSVKMLQFINSNIRTFEKKALNIRADEVLFDNNKISILESRSISLIANQRGGQTTEFAFRANTVQRVQQHAFQIRSQGPIVISNNVFDYIEGHAFHKISPIYLSPEMNFVFDDNELLEYEKQALALMPPFQIKNLRLNENCHCNFSAKIRAFLLGSHSDSATDDNNEEEEEIQTILCINDYYISTQEYEDNNCNLDTDSTTKIVISIILVIFIVTLIVVVYLLRNRTIQLKEKKKKTERLEEQITSLHLFGPILWKKRHKIEEEMEKKYTMVYPGSTLEKIKDMSVNLTKTSLDMSRSQNVYEESVVHVKAEVAKPLEEPHIYVTLA
ncbi:hypothetical protein QYM36_010451 [Artemia franciscana]|uniref:Uncharacterized protein n=1 Tax=Artemia franciscana TaxID=6661 RepID=A0AA88HXK3_ARTSF|nr:hypothetical protein QYM36_010451 [Artemia franciscana]